MRTFTWVVALTTLACAGSNDPSGSSALQTAAPTFSPPGSTYASAQLVTVVSATPGSSVRCTRDGSAPTSTSPICTTVTVAETATLRAIATAPGFADSAVASATYTIEATVPAAASPTFAPPAGTYSAAQSVTVATTTPGATVRCTLDGSAPSAATPACATPIAVSTSATLRAIATAPGFADSALASATYVIQTQPPADPTLAEQLRALASKRQIFAHQSVGNNILYGNGGGGLDELLDANPGSGVTIAYDPASAAAVPAGGVADTAIGVNGQPVGKVLDFDSQVRTRFGGALDYFAFKFCFTDIWTAQDVSDTWAQYQTTMDALEVAYPGKIIHWTVPLMPDVTDIDGNTQREALSNLIRSKYGSTGRVFDLASYESHDAQGNPITLGGVPALAHDWSADGGHDAHLNAAGATMVATRWIEFMYGVATGGAP